MATASVSSQGSIGAVTPQPSDMRAQSWDGGRFVTARRERTKLVEGSILLPDHVVMVTLRGGAARHETISACGARSDGPDRAGLASFLPAGCERRLRLHEVRWHWASIAIRPDIMERALTGGARAIRPFSNREDPFLLGLLGEFERLHARDGALDATYCDAMTLALAHYLAAGQQDEANHAASSLALPAWKLRRIRDFVEAQLAGDIRIGELAALAGLSEGHFHRAFRAATGSTPLQFVNERRIESARRMLADETLGMTELAARVGFVSPSYFARTFRQMTGVNPSRYRRERASG